MLSNNHFNIRTLLTKIQIFGLCCMLLNGLSAHAQYSASDPYKRNDICMCTNYPLPLLDPNAKWDFVKRRLGYLKLYIDWINKASPDELSALVSVLKQNNIKIAVEAGGTLANAPMDNTNGQVSAQITMRKLRKLLDAGGEISYFDLDGSVRRLLGLGKNPGPRAYFTSVPACVDQLVNFMRAMRANLPNVQFYEITNFPNWGWKGGPSYHGKGPRHQDWGEYYNVIQTIIHKTNAAGIPIAGVTVDAPYEYAVGIHKSATIKNPQQFNWLGRIRDLENYVEGQSLEFNLILNSEVGGATSDKEFCQRTLRYLDAYRAAGGHPTRYMIQSWYPFPKEIVPENKQYTFTWLVRTIMGRTQ
jgi:hypothetical protein